MLYLVALRFHWQTQTKTLQSSFAPNQENERLQRFTISRSPHMRCRCPKSSAENTRTNQKQNKHKKQNQKAEIGSRKIFQIAILRCKTK